jgi:hypothetical protein
MRDLLGTSAWWNAPLRNPTQNIFTRFVKQPQAELADALKEYRDKFSEFGKKALHTELSQYLGE